MRPLRLLVTACAAALALAPAASAGGPTMLVGAAENIVLQPDPVVAKAKVDLAKLAGLDALRVVVFWAPGTDRPSDDDLAALKNVAAASKLDAIQLFIAVSNFGSRTTPLSDEDRASFAKYAAAVADDVPGVTGIVVGTEPNLNRFWLPQFNPDGSDAAAPAYEQLLAETYDAIKAADPTVLVLGGAVSPRGGDDPRSTRLTHSPTTFIADLGTAYRASGRTLPIMDALAFHPYQDNSSIPPSFQHPNSTTIAIADYGKLVTLLGQAFDGTAQNGSTLPIYYTEFGVESQIPTAKASLYTGTEPATTKPVDEATQAAYYTQAIGMAFCQPNVRGIFVFHVVDEEPLDRWQSGLYYADETPKPSLAAVKTASATVRRGVAARCEGLQLPVKATLGPLRTGAQLSFLLRCDLDCTYQAQVERYPPGATPVLVARGGAIGARTKRVYFPAKKLAAGRYRITVTLAAALNPGPAQTLRGAPFRLR